MAPYERHAPQRVMVLDDHDDANLLMMEHAYRVKRIAWPEGRSWSAWEEWEWEPAQADILAEDWHLVDKSAP
jgi:hypothetical protein